MRLSTATNYCMRIEDAVHYLRSEVMNIIDHNILPTSNLAEVPFELLDAEYLLFEYQKGQNVDDNIIKITDIDIIMLSIVETHNAGTKLNSINIDKDYIMVIKRVMEISQKPFKKDNK
jgi:hypothetical protein